MSPMLPTTVKTRLALVRRDCRRMPNTIVWRKWYIIACIFYNSPIDIIIWRKIWNVFYLLINIRFHSFLVHSPTTAAICKQKDKMNQLQSVWFVEIYFNAQWKITYFTIFISVNFIQHGRKILGVSSSSFMW